MNTVASFDRLRMRKMGGWHRRFVDGIEKNASS